MGAVKHLDKKLISWASILEEKTEAQAKTTATLPFIFPHMALMPDAHLGKGATVGSVIPTEKAIIPAAYKDIDVVMEDAADLAEVKHTLRQIINVKGD